MLLRTGLRVSEYTSLRADAAVHIGAGQALALGADRPNLGMPEHLLAVSWGVDQAGRMFLAAN
jgi:hypothetical protein